MKSFFVVFGILLQLGMAQAQTSIPLPDARLEALARRARLSAAMQASLKLSSSYTDVRTGLQHSYWQQYWWGYVVKGASASLHQGPDGEPVFQQARLYAQPKLPAYTTTAAQAQAEAARLLGSPLDSSFAQLIWEVQGPDSLSLAWQVRCHAPQLMRLLSLSATNLQLLAHHNLLLACSPAEHQPRTMGLSFGECPPPLTGGGRAIRSIPSLQSGIRFYPSLGRTQGGQSPPLPPVGQYTCLPWPLESPLLGSLQTLAATSLVDEGVSPQGWHSTGSSSYNYTRGNNAYAYYAPFGGLAPTATAIQRDGNGQYLSGIVPNVGSGLNFVFNQPLNTGDGLDFLESAIVNAFVSANRMHDLLLHYGFDEAAGNFQSVNFSGQGAANDPVQVMVQRNGLNAAFFTCPVDGAMPSMRLHLWDGSLLDTIPDGLRDAAFDNLVVAHEYTHGLLFRMVGGPNVVTCLDSHEQGSEGYCDVVGMLVTLADQNGNGSLEAHVPGEGIRSIGSYLQGEAAYGPGLRTYPYSPNMGLNPVTYDSIPHFSAPHQIGFVWGSMLWDIVWDLMDTYGYTPNLYDASSGAGNVRALRLLVESLRYLACDPDFLDMRDALLQADTLLYGGQLSEQLWTCFARRGLGFSAQSGGIAAYNTPGSALPVSWLSFEAKPASKGIELHWATATERQNAGFYVQRRTQQQAAPTDLAWVDARAEEGSGAQYYFFDENALPHVTYLYRLRQKDINGTESYSRWQSAQWKNSEESPLRIWPNPANDQLYLSYSDPQREARWSLVDLQGRVLAAGTLDARQTLTLDLSPYPAGWLVLGLTTDEGHTCQRILHLPNAD